MSQSNKMPAIFLAHGAPSNALEQNMFTEDWLTLYQGMTKPKAIVLFSAHWHISGTIIQSQAEQKTIHDFAGFSAELFQCQYPAKGDPELAQNISQTLHEHGIQNQSKNDWGLDHGSWAILKHLYPDADIPCLQISMDINEHDLSKHFAIGKALQNFREQGVLFIGSGNIVHNIPKWMMIRASDPIDWAVDFDQAVWQAIQARDWQSLFNYQNMPYAHEAVPTVEHYLPLIYIAGLSDSNDAITCSNFAEDSLASACSRSIRFG